MNELIKSAAAEIEKQNEEFGYKASKGEIAAQVWHSYLAPMQRMELSKGVKGSTLASIRECYARVEGLI